eukprot:780304-Pelagomonas_calceolata.AAC.1
MQSHGMYGKQRHHANGAQLQGMDTCCHTACTGSRGTMQMEHSCKAWTHAVTRHVREAREQHANGAQLQG